MGLNAREIGGSKKLLELLDIADLLALAATVTKRRSTESTKAEAIDTIVQSSQSAYELLNRKKVLCDIIVAYLTKEGVPLPKKITKAEAVLQALVYWSKPDSYIPIAGTYLQKNLHYIATIGLSARERVGSRKLLELLDTADLLALAATVTKKKSTASTKEEAIDTILQNSQSAYELLNRRKVVCDIIAAYLKKEGVPIPTNITKAEAVLQALVYWSKPGIAAEARGQRNLSSKVCSPQEKSSWWSAQNGEEPEREYLQSKETSPYDIDYRLPASKNFVSPQPVVDDGYTVPKGKRGKPQKSQSLPVSGTVPHMKTRSLLGAEWQPANFEAKTKKVSSPPYTGITRRAAAGRSHHGVLSQMEEKRERERLRSEKMSPQHYEKVFRPQTAHQSAPDESDTEEVVTSLPSAAEE